MSFSPKIRGWLFAGGGLGLALVAVSCSSSKREFGSCSDADGCSAAGASDGGTSGTGGSNNAAGESNGGSDQAGAAGQGEAGAGAPPAACTTAADCNDGKACNGSETSPGGLCKSGTPACDAEPGCVVTCSESASGPSCSKLPEDKDGDGHLAPDNTCSAITDEPLDDCDDSHATVYAGAPEICDGLDNDCDGLDDFAEGLPLGGSIRTLVDADAVAPGDSYAAAQWSSTLGAYGVVWSNGPGVYFARLSAAGEMIGTPQKFIDDGLRHSSALALAWAGNTFGLAWTSVTSDATPVTTVSFARFQVAAPDFTPKRVDTVPVALNGASNVSGVGYADGGGWLALAADSSNTATVYRLSDKAALIPPPATLGVGSWYFNGVASSNGEVGAYWLRQEMSGTTTLGYSMQFARWKGANMTQSLAPTTILAPTANYSGGTASASALSDGFLLVHRSKAQHVALSRRSFDGSTDCGPVELTTSLYPWAVDGEERSTANDSSGFYLAQTSDSKAVISRLPLDCDVNSVSSGNTTLPLGESPDGGGIYLALASSPKGHLIVWSLQGAVHARAFGNAFCDTPH